MKWTVLSFFLFLFLFGNCGKKNEETKIVVGAEQPEKYLQLLQGKRVGLVVNHTAMVGEKHLLDFLLQLKIDVKMVFAPEHGFRGEASAGEKVLDGIDQLTGVQVISLYGNIRKPTAAHLSNIDVLLFDIQDVGCRFYTYLSTLQQVIEAGAENNVPLLVLDRPNPNGDYIAGPMLKPEFKSFVGQVPVPVVHGCTMGEMAEMINGEHWHKAAVSCRITVIPVKNYTHNYIYQLPVRPSPNLPNHLSVRLYPSLCFFEATSVSIGRGTDFPFQVLGGTLPSLGSFQFVPVDIPGVVNNPINEGKTCYGIDLRQITDVPKFTLSYFLDFYHKYPAEKDFLTSERWLNLLSGSDALIKGIREGKTEAALTDSWLEELNSYRVIRKKYLLYTDFE